MKFQTKTGSEWHTTETRSAMVYVNNIPIFQVLKPLSQEWEMIGNKGRHGKWAISEYDIPESSQVLFVAKANGREDISHSFVVGKTPQKIDFDGYVYNNCLCGWILEID